MAFSAATTFARRRAKAALLAAMKSVGPFSAAMAACWAMLFGLEVDCDCSFAIALTSGGGAAAKPIRQPVMQ